MREQAKPLEELVKELPPELQEEVRDFVEFLLEKRGKKLCGKPRFDWAGALKDLRDQYTSSDTNRRGGKPCTNRLK